MVESDRAGPGIWGMGQNLSLGLGIVNLRTLYQGNQLDKVPQTEFQFLYLKIETVFLFGGRLWLSNENICIMPRAQ